MTVKELIEILQDFKQDLDVVYLCEESDSTSRLDVNVVLYAQDMNVVVISES